MIDKTERLKVLIYEYFFFNEAKYRNNVIVLGNRCNYRKIDTDLLYDLHNAQLAYNTFDDVMSDVLKLLTDFR